MDGTGRSAGPQPLILLSASSMSSTSLLLFCALIVAEAVRIRSEHGVTITATASPSHAPP
jgi:hypothetical protein